MTYTKTITQPGNEGKVYRIRVAAVNSIGTGSYSASLLLTATNAPDTPTLALVSRTSNSVYLSFTPGASNGGSAITGYLLYRDQGVTGSPSVLAYNGTGLPEIIRYNDTDLTTGLTYTF